MRQTVVAQVRRHPLAFLAGLAGMGLEIVVDRLLHTRYIWSYFDPYGSALVLALQVLGFVLLLPILRIIPLRHRPEVAQVHDDEQRQPGTLPLRAGVAQRASRWQIVEYVVWSSALSFALAQLVTAVSGALVWSGVLAGLVALLSLTDISLSIAVRTSPRT